MAEKTLDDTAFGETIIRLWEVGFEPVRMRWRRLMLWTQTKHEISRVAKQNEQFNVVQFWAVWAQMNFYYISFSFQILIGQNKGALVVHAPVISLVVLIRNLKFKFYLESTHYDTAESQNHMQTS